MFWVVWLSVMGLCIYYLVVYVFWHSYKEWERKRAVSMEKCAEVGHAIERIHAYDDPRYPVDNCTRCPYQKHIKFFCPYCRKEIGWKVKSNSESSDRTTEPSP